MTYNEHEITNENNVISTYTNEADWMATHCNIRVNLSIVIYVDLLSILITLTYDRIVDYETYLGFKIVRQIIENN